jgi:hypothetical protein
MVRRLQPTERTMALTNETSTNEANAAAGGAVPGADNKTSPGRKGKPGTKSAVGAASSSRKAAAVGKTRPKAKPAQAAETKASIVVKKLSSPKGVTIEILMEATDWQAHSVRGFLSAVVKKKLGLNLISEIGKDGVRRYRIGEAGKAK